MQNKKEIADFISKSIKNQEWISLTNTVRPEDLSNFLGFQESMNLIGDLIQYSESIMIEDNYSSDTIRNYVVELMFILRNVYPDLWNSDWKNEAFLGIACMFTYRDEDAFRILKNLYEKKSDPPQSLILSYIGSGTGKTKFLSTSEIEKLTELAVKKGISYEVAVRMANIAAMKQDKKKQEYWKEQANAAKRDNRFTAVIVPDLLKNICRQRQGRLYED